MGPTPLSVSLAEPLLDAESGDGSGDDKLLDLLGAFEDVEGLNRQYLLLSDVGATP